MLERARALFEVERVASDPDALRARVSSSPSAAFGVLAAGGRAALLRLKPSADLAGHEVLGQRPAVLRTTSVALLHDGILEHVLGIGAEAQAAKTNIKYLQDARAGHALVESGQGQALFVMAATSVETIRRVAEAGEVMPQKSTFFYPKVLTGLFFHTLDPSRSVA
jgi:uncharacterized protein (DUF1015 family)